MKYQTYTPGTEWHALSSSSPCASSLRMFGPYGEQKTALLSKHREAPKTCSAWGSAPPGYSARSVSRRRSYPRARSPRLLT